MSSTSYTTQYVMSVMGVAVLSQVVVSMKLLQTSASNKQLIRGFLTFFSVSLCYFPVSLMLGGVRYRNKFFQRSGVEYA
tara:strand:+ start:215 stop:451 length:237 start_codon:yes stop_codon:yes gene_type:complete